MTKKQKRLVILLRFLIGVIQQETPPWLFKSFVPNVVPPLSTSFVDHVV